MIQRLYFLPLLLLLLPVLPAAGNSNNVMVLHDVSAPAGEIITMELEIMTDDEFVGFNLDVQLPYGFTFVQNSAELHRTSNHTLSFTIIPGNVSRIIAFSITNDTFSGSEGIILTFEIQTPAIPGEYEFKINNAIIGNINARDILTATVDATISLLEAN